MKQNPESILIKPLMKREQMYSFFPQRKKKHRFYSKGNGKLLQKLNQESDMICLFKDHSGIV